MRNILVALTALALTALLTVASAQAQPAANYPTQPIKVIVSVPAGGGVDTAMRIVAEGMRQRLASQSSSKIAAARPAISAPKPCSRPSPMVTR